MKSSSKIAEQLSSSKTIAFKNQIQGRLSKIVQDSKSSEEKLLILKKTLLSMHEQYSKLIVQRQKETLEYNALQALYEAVLDKEGTVHQGGVYDHEAFINLINQHPEAYKFVLEKLPAPKKQELESNVKQIQAHDPNSARIMLWYGINAVLSMPNDLWRFVTFKPRRPNDRAMALVKDCIKDYLHDYETRSKQYSVTELQTTQGYLHNLLETSDQIEVVFDHLKQYNEYLESFVKEHEGFFVRLSNRLAKISYIFKSEMAILIDEVKEAQRGLVKIKQDCLTQFIQLEDLDSHLLMQLKLNTCFRRNHFVMGKELNKKTMEAFIDELCGKFSQFYPSKRSEIKSAKLMNGEPTAYSTFLAFFSRKENAVSQRLRSVDNSPEPTSHGL